MQRKTWNRIIPALAGLAAAGVAALPAAAHPGHAGHEALGVVAGLAHPLTGLDHLLAMVGVGLWSRRQTHGVWLAPAFVLMMAIGALYLICIWKRNDWLFQPWFLKLFIFATPLGFIALEAGWTVTEVGRQPWIIQDIMLTKDAVTPMPGIQYSFYLFTFVYFTLSVAVIILLQRQIKMVPVLYDVKDN